MRCPNSGLTVGQAVALGALHGPAELLPISSSAHTTAVPWLLGWCYDELEPELRKSFEVALHAGTAVALVIALRSELRQLLGELDRRRVVLLGLASAPAAIVGLAFEREIEQQLGTPASIAAALSAGAVVMALADRFPGERRRADAGPWDGVWLGLAQACALVPGISRTGATLATARFLGFEAKDAKELSDEVALPVLAGATSLKAARLRRRGIEPPMARLFVAGAGAAFVSTLACATLPQRQRSAHRLWPWAAYRIALAGLISVRLRLCSTGRRRGQALD